MKKRQLLSLCLIGLFSINTASAHIINLKDAINHTSNTAPKKYTAQEELHIATSIIPNFVNGWINAEDDEVGTTQAGDGGYSVGMAYLTHDLKFGYIAVDGLDETNGFTGNIVAYSDPLALGNTKWNLKDGAESNGMLIKSDVWTANRKLYEIAVDYFNKSGMIKRLGDANYNNLDSYFIQTNPEKNGAEYIATTLYTRWYYDTDARATGVGTGEPYFTSKPILTAVNGGGPYLGINNYLDIAMDVEGPNGATHRTNINKNMSKYLISMNSLIAKGAVGFPSNGARWSYLNSDAPFTRPGGFVGTRVNNDKAVLEKRIEYRRYIDKKSETKFEYVYPYEEETVSTQSAIPNKQPEVSVKMVPQSVDANGKATKYTLTTTIIGLNKSTNGPNTDKEYTIYDAKDNASVKAELAKEVSENQMDMWHTGASGNSTLTGTVKIIKNGTVLKEIPVTSGKNQVKTIDTGGVDYSECDVVLEVPYTLNSRYMYKKTRYVDLYKKDPSDTTYMDYSTTYNYVQKLDDNNTVVYTQDLKKVHSDIARTTYNYKTVTVPNLKATAKNYIFATSSNTSTSFKEPIVTLTTDPKNVTTQLEGGKFTVEGLIDGLEPTLPSELLQKPDGNPTNKRTYTVVDKEVVPSPEKKFAEWHDDIIVTKFTIQAPDGDYWVNIDTEKGDPPITAEGIGVVDVILSKQFLEAKPTQVGKAKIYIEYEYTYNYRTETSVIPNTELIMDANGNLIPKDYEVTYETKSYHKKGSKTEYFNIYSVSGNTVN